MENQGHFSAEINSLRTGTAVSNELLQQAMDREKVVPVEINGKRELVSRTDLFAMDEFVTVDSPFHRTVEALLENLPVSRSLGEVMASLDLPNTAGPQQTILASPNWNMDGRVLDLLSLRKASFNLADRNLEITWTKRESDEEAHIIVPGEKRLSGLSTNLEAIIIVPDDAVSDSNSWDHDTVIATEYGAFVHPKNKTREELEYYLSGSPNDGHSTYFLDAVIAVLLNHWGNDYARVRGIDEVANMFTRRGDEITVESLKQATERFRALEVIVIEGEY